MLSRNIMADNEYKSIVSKYLEDEQVQALANIPHHDSNRLEHSLKVSYYSYNICKKIGLDYESVAKAGLLHDFYFNRIDECPTMGDKVKLFMNDHPEDALKNALRKFYLTPLEEDIIVSHMWPASKHVPKHKESFVVSCVDKIFSLKEFGLKLNYNVTFMTGVCFIFCMYSFFK